MPNINIGGPVKVSMQVDQAGSMNIELPQVFAINNIHWISREYCNEYALFTCTDRVCRLARHGFPWLKEFNENLLFWNEEKFFMTAEGYWRLKSTPRAKSRFNMLYMFYGEKVL